MTDYKGPEVTLPEIVPKVFFKALKLQILKYILKCIYILKMLVILTDYKRNWGYTNWNCIKIEKNIPNLK